MIKGNALDLSFSPRKRLKIADAVFYNIVLFRDFQKINYSINNNDNHFKGGGMKGLPTADPS
ncbi:hypothetical protein, partial [Nostoc sp.]|uniref:hypothetical protein n=1 Tax=Nostoc sp. TaxID=1180 RepID=UPI002FF94C41